jgi:uncharacterized protein YcbK (DUF882 family)
MQLTNNFNKIEFESGDGQSMPASVLANIKVLAENLQKVRDFLNEPMHINSGYRSDVHNAAVGGVRNSQHLLGTAADITMKNFTAKDLALIFERMTASGEILQGGLGLYNGFIHYDIRGTKARWNLSTRYKDAWE